MQTYLPKNPYQDQSMSVFTTATNDKASLCQTQKYRAIQKDRQVDTQTDKETDNQTYNRNWTTTEKKT